MQVARREGKAQTNWRSQPAQPFRAIPEMECKKFDRVFYRLKSSQVNNVVRMRTYLAVAEKFESDLSPEDLALIPNGCGGEAYLEEFNVY